MTLIFFLALKKQQKKQSKQANKTLKNSELMNAVTYVLLMLENIDNIWGKKLVVTSLLTKSENNLEKNSENIVSQKLSVGST